MLDQLRLESYGCKMRVTTAVSLLGWTGIITGVLAIIAGIMSVFYLNGYCMVHYNIMDVSLDNDREMKSV